MRKHNRSRSRSSSSGIATRKVANRISGDDFEATFEVSIPILQFSEAGTWTVRIYLTDAVGNVNYLQSADLQALGFENSFEVTN